MEIGYKHVILWKIHSKDYPLSYTLLKPLICFAGSIFIEGNLG